MTIEITNKSGALAPGDQIQSLLAFVMSKLDLHPDCDLNVTFVDDTEMTELHIKWMDEPGSTDVLSFPMDEMKPNSAANGPGVIGDIVLCPAFAERNGKQSLAQELELLTVHGVLHLLGYDHEEIDQEVAMFKLQEDFLQQWRALQ